jgi:hypothetical protein
MAHINFSSKKVNEDQIFSEQIPVAVIGVEGDIREQVHKNNCQQF